MKLSDLQLNQVFFFKEGEVVTYKVHNNRYTAMETQEHMHYEVIKVNTISVDVQSLHSRIKFNFIFNGTKIYNYNPADVKDCEVELI